MPRDLTAQGEHGTDDQDGDQREDQSVLGEGLALFALYAWDLIPEARGRAAERRCSTCASCSSSLALATSSR